MRQPGLQVEQHSAVRHRVPVAEQDDAVAVDDIVARAGRLHAVGNEQFTPVRFRRQIDPAFVRRRQFLTTVAMAEQQAAQ